MEPAPGPRVVGGKSVQYLIGFRVLMFPLHVEVV